MHAIAGRPTARPKSAGESTSGPTTAGRATCGPATPLVPFAPPPAALCAADGLTLAIADATRAMPRRAARLAHALRESAVLAQAGTAAACREARPDRRREGLAAVDRSLDRLARWLGLAERFGDLQPHTVLALLEHLSRLRVELLARVGAEPERPPQHPVTHPLAHHRAHHQGMTLDVNNASRYDAS